MAPAASSSNTGKSSSAGRGVAAHQLSNGLYVSGTAERNSKDSKAHRMGVSQMPYTGGNILDSGEIGKMLNIQATTPTPTTHNNNAAGNKKTRSSSPSCQESRSCPASPSAQSNLRSSSFNAAYTSHINNPFTSPTIIHCNSSNSNSHSRSHSHSSRTTPFIPARGMTGSQSPSLAATGLITGLAASGSGRKANVVVLGNGTTQLQNESHTSATTTTATAASPSPGNSSRTLLASPGASLDRTHGSGQNHGAVATGSVHNNNNSNESVNNLSHVKSFSFMKTIPRLILWSIFSLFVILFAIGAFVLEAAKSVVVLVVVGVLLALVCALLAWNSWWGRQSLLSFVGHHPQSDLRNAKDGQMVCITGVRELSLSKTHFPHFPFFFLSSFLFFSLDHHHPPKPGVIFTFGTRIKTVFFLRRRIGRELELELFWSIFCNWNQTSKNQFSAAILHTECTSSWSLFCIWRWWVMICRALADFVVTSLLQATWHILS